MLVDLNLKGQNVLVIIGDIEEARRRMGQAREAGAKVKRVKEKYKEAISAFHPFLTMISTGERSLDRKLADYARKRNSLVYVVDFPELNDLNMPAVAKLGDIRVAISTGGNSPAMASILRKRIEKNITREDILQVRLHGKIRGRIKGKFKDHEARKKAVYALLEDKKIKKLLSSSRVGSAHSLALKKIDEWNF